MMALVVGGCNLPTATPVPTEPASVSQDFSWQNVQQAGVLRVGIPADYPPFEYFNENDQLDGFDVALIQQIGQKLGLMVELNPISFVGLPMAVAVGQVDVAIGALSVTPERQALANFSNVYYAGSDAVLSRSEADPKNLQNPQSKEATVVQYTLVARNNAGVADARDATVQVVGAPPQNPLADTSWQLQNMQGAGDVPADVAITAYFGAGGGLSGIAGCNPYSGSYTADGQAIAIRNLSAEENTVASRRWMPT
jgi:ABC-type amino acid transport substrate-binding protein